MVFFWHSLFRNSKRQTSVSMITVIAATVIIEIISILSILIIRSSYETLLRNETLARHSRESFKQQAPKQRVSFINRQQVLTSVLKIGSLLLERSPTYATMTTPMTTPAMAMFSSYSIREIRFRLDYKNIPLQNSLKFQLAGSLFVELNQKYASYMLDFKDDEKKAIISAISTNEYLTSLDWFFIKKSDKIDAAESYVLSRYICLSQTDVLSFLNANDEHIPATDDDASQNVHDDVQSFLMRMASFLDQKKNPKKYGKWYQSAGFQSNNNLHIPQSIADYLYSDPNVPDKLKWCLKFEDSADSYWIGRFIEGDRIVSRAYLVDVPRNQVADSVDIDLISEKTGYHISDLHHPACVMAKNPVALLYDSPEDV